MKIYILVTAVQYLSLQQGRDFPHSVLGYLLPICENYKQLLIRGDTNLLHIILQGATTDSEILIIPTWRIG